MATIKSYTDIEQSKKLAEILPLESADMWYHGHSSPLESERKYDNEPCPFHSMSPNWDKPCWSLSALLRLMPNSQTIKIDNVYYSIVSFKHEYGTSSFRTSQYDNPIDAAFEMVVWLKKE